MSINWDSIKFRASSWGNLLTEPRTKSEPLSVTCQKELIKIYNEVKYGRKKDLVTKQMEKGTICEPEGIAMFGEVEGKEFHKNIFRLENEWFCGHPDIYVGENIIETEECHEIKCSWELDSFMPKLFEEVDKGYEAQLNVYFDLLGEQCRTGSITYCLVSAPENMVLDEQRRLLYTMDVVSEDNPSSNFTSLLILALVYFVAVYTFLSFLKYLWQILSASNSHDTKEYNQGLFERRLRLALFYILDCD